MDIIYRHYQPGDEAQLADLFNRAFQMNGGGFVRTPKTWYWRYVQSPNFEPEQCQLAVDTSKDKIVGAIYVNLVETIPLQDKEYIVGDINDVSCHPDYTGQGIATKLMEMSIDYMKNRNCDISMLTADYNGFARKKIYLKYGYKDVDRSNLYFNFPYIPKVVKDLPALTGFIPSLVSLSLIPRFLNRVRLKWNSSFQEISYEISHNQKHLEYMRAANQIIPKYYTGFPLYSKEKIMWGRINLPAKRYEPTYIIISRNGKIIGGACLTHQNLYAFQYGVKFRIGILHDLFLDEHKFQNKRSLHFGYNYLMDKVMKAASQRKIGGLYISVDSKLKSLQQSLTAMGFLKFKGPVVMIKVINQNIKLPLIEKPLYVPTYVSTGIP